LAAASAPEFAVFLLISDFSDSYIKAQSKRHAENTFPPHIVSASSFLIKLRLNSSGDLNPVFQYYTFTHQLTKGIIMKQLFSCIIFFISFTVKGQSPGSSPPVDTSFYLLFNVVGFGSNRFDMQPVFRVKEGRFFYTSEDAWYIPGKRINRDTLLTGFFRKTSIDSLLTLLSFQADSVIYKANIHIISGAACHITISTDTRKYVFTLHNETDPVAKKIAAILNSYIHYPLRQLFVF